VALIKRRQLESSTIDPMQDQIQNFINEKPSRPSYEHLNEARDLVQEQASVLLQQTERELEDKRRHVGLELQQMLETAKQEAAQIIQAAKIEASQAKEEAHKSKEDLEKERQNLYQQIEKEKASAFKEAESKIDFYIADVVAMLSSFNHKTYEIFEELKPQIVSIAFDMAKQILNYELSQNPEIIQEQLIRSANKVASSKGLMQIYLNEKDLHNADYLNKVLSKMIDPDIRLVFLQDNKVDPGSCIINTQGGRLDASFTSQIEALKLVFARYLGYPVQDIEQLETSEPILDESAIPIVLKSPKPFIAAEPSDEELENIESNFGEYVDLDLDLQDDEDLDQLLGNVVQKKEEAMKKNPGKNSNKTSSLERDDSEDIGANDYASDDDLDFEDDLDDEESAEFEEFDETAGQGYDDDSDLSDARFPQY
jgi:flagellar biosynthesis/type III secretory pathway protein FliH